MPELAAPDCPDCVGICELAAGGGAVAWARMTPAPIVGRTTGTIPLARAAVVVMLEIITVAQSAILLLDMDLILVTSLAGEGVVRVCRKILDTAAIQRADMQFAAFASDFSAPALVEIGHALFEKCATGNMAHRVATLLVFGEPPILRCTASRQRESAYEQ